MHETRIFSAVLQIFSGACHRITLQWSYHRHSSLICGVTVQRNFKSPMKTFYVRHWVQILILLENSLSFKIMCFSSALTSSQHSAPKVMAKIENLGFKPWLSVCNVGSTRRVARNSQWGGCLGDLGAEPPAAGGQWGSGGEASSCQRLTPSARKFAVFCKNNFILGLF